MSKSTCLLCNKFSENELPEEVIMCKEHSIEILESIKEGLK